MIVISKQTISLTSTFKRGFVLIFSATFVFTLCQQYLDRKIEGLLRSPEGLNSTIWFWGALSLVTALIFPLVQTLFATYSTTLDLHKTNLTRFFSEHIELGLIEMLRTWGKSFLWFFIFILPGFVFYFYYSLSIYVVLLSAKYNNGEVDALEESMTTVKTHWIYYSVLFFIFTFIAPLVITQVFDEYRLFSQHPLTAFFCVAVDSILLLIFQFLILNKYIEQLLEKKDLKYGAHV